MINGAKAPDAMHKAKVDMTTGMAVIKEDSDTDKFANVTSDESVKNLFFINKERIPTGTNAAKVDMSDYDPDFTGVKANEYVTLEKYSPGEVFCTDQYDNESVTAETAINTRISFKNGEAMVSTIASPFIFKGFFNDNGHTLVKIEVADDMSTNS